MPLDLLQLRFQIAAGLKRFAVKTAEDVDGFEHRIQAEVGKSENRGDKSGICRGGKTLAKNGFDAEQLVQQKWDGEDAGDQVDEHEQGKRLQQEKHIMILQGPESCLTPGAFEKLAETVLLAIPQGSDVLIEGVGPTERQQDRE